MRLRTRMLASCITHLYRFIAFLILDREVCHVQLFLKVPQSQSSTCCYHEIIVIMEGYKSTYHE